MVAADCACELRARKENTLTLASQTYVPHASFVNIHTPIMQSLLRSVPLVSCRPAQGSSANGQSFQDHNAVHLRGIISRINHCPGTPSLIPRQSSFNGKPSSPEPGAPFSRSRPFHLCLCPHFLPASLFLCNRTFTQTTHLIT